MKLPNWLLSAACIAVLLIWPALLAWSWGLHAVASWLGCGIVLGFGLLMANPEAISDGNCGSDDNK